jgi:hypothetical protein
MRQELGDLDRVRRVVKILGMVNAVPDFREQSKVINGCSDLLVRRVRRAARSLGGTGCVSSSPPLVLRP